MRNDNDRNPKDFYGKTEAELRKLKQTAGPINLRKHCIKPA